MGLQNRSILFLDEKANLGRVADTGVSLHCHTRFSKEMLDFLPFYAEKIPVISHIWKRECRRYETETGKAPDFTTGYWEPPLDASQVFESESMSLAEWGLNSLVSITDHDSIEGAVEIEAERGNDCAPISMEWTVPFGRAYFHLGVHNLPPRWADGISTELLEYTFAKGEPDNIRLHEIFAMLNGHPDILIVFNHPIWDIEMIGQTEHNRLLEAFVEEHIDWIHAIEVNGFRPWSENRAAIDLASSVGLPLISGGDRHCLHANAMINITDATSFAQFVDEIRVDKVSTIAVIPEYAEPLMLRQVRSMAEILGNYPDFSVGRQFWYERVYFDAGDGSGVRSLADHWHGSGPVLYRLGVDLLAIIGHRRLRPLYRLTEARADLKGTREATKTHLHFGQGRLVAGR